MEGADLSTSQTFHGDTQNIQGVESITYVNVIYEQTEDHFNIWTLATKGVIVSTTPVSNNSHNSKQK